MSKALSKVDNAKLTTSQSKPFVDWTPDDVQTWLLEKGLQQQKFKEFNGQTLKGLQKLYRESSVAFNQSLTDHFEINDFTYKMKFGSCLDALK